MSAALQLPSIYAAGTILQQWRILDCVTSCDAETPLPRAIVPEEPHAIEEDVEASPGVTLAYYRRHTVKMLRRYLYSSMLVGRAPAILGEPVSRGWVSCRRVKTFEDAVIFVLDIERILEKLSPVDRAILSRIVLQEYTFAETAALLGISRRAMSYKYPQALDRLTEFLLRYGLLIVSSS